VEPRPAGGPAIGAGRRPRVLLLIKCLGYGGAEQLLVDVVANRDDDAFDYEVAYVLAAENGLVPAVEASGVTVHALGARGNGDLGWMARLRRLLITGDYDLVHFHLPYAAALGRLVALTVPKNRRPILMYTEHSLWGKTPIAVRGLNRIAIGHDGSLIAVSKAAGDALPGPLRERATVVVHGIDQGRAAGLRARRDAVRLEVRAELGVPDGAVLALSVANLRSEKGYDVLLEAARRVLDSGAAVHFAAVGRGPQAAEVEALHASLALGERFLLLGPRSDALRLMAGADVFVLASHHEGLPVTIMEATSVGLPIVTTAVGEIPNFLTNGEDALIVPPGDPVALAGAIGRLVADESLRRRLGQGALVHSAMFDVARAVTDIEVIYTRLLAGVA
jgi:glycosyltransferase involved in cell wall biosynthesis